MGEEQRKLYKTKTFWTGIVAVISGVGIAIQGDIPTGIQTAIGGLAVIFLRSAVR